jgi:hypothetical protein
MEQLDHLLGYFNLLLGTTFILTGFRILKPFKGEEGEKRFQKMRYMMDPFFRTTD